mmetsp:Transcript_49622/g.117257  ORF Transcript_49622/g.117257 Transcript_49622/m.117257 type:complete len:235 (-) Transcript_49622:530-1234(-)
MGGARWVESMCAGGVRGKQENRPSGEEEEEGTQRARLEEPPGPNTSQRPPMVGARRPLRTKRTPPRVPVILHGTASQPRIPVILHGTRWWRGRGSMRGCCSRRGRSAGARWRRCATFIRSRWCSSRTTRGCSRATWAVRKSRARCGFRGWSSWRTGRRSLSQSTSTSWRGRWRAAPTTRRSSSRRSPRAIRLTSSRLPRFARTYRPYTDRGSLLTSPRPPTSNRLPAKTPRLRL